MSAPTEFEPMDGPRHIDVINRDCRPNSSVAVGEMVAALINAQTAEALRATVQRLEAGEAITHAADMLLVAAEALKTRLALVEAAIARLLIVHEK